MPASRNNAKHEIKISEKELGPRMKSRTNSSSGFWEATRETSAAKKSAPCWLTRLKLSILPDASARLYRRQDRNSAGLNLRTTRPSDTTATLNTEMEAPATSVGSSRI